MAEISKQYFVQVSERSVWRVIKFIGFIFLMIVVVVGLVYLKDLMLPLVISIFLSYLLEPAVDAMENRGMNRTIAVSVLFVAIIAAIALLVFLLSDTVSAELQNLLSGTNVQDPQKLIDQFRMNLETNFPSLAKTNIFARLAEQASAYAKNFMSTSMESATHMVGALGHMIIIPFIIFFFLKESRELKKFIVQSLPNRWFEMALSLIHKISLQLGRFIRGQLTDSAIVGFMITVALLILDVRYAIFIGILAGLANMIPYLGPVVGGIPAVLVSVMDNGDFSGVPSIILAFAVIKIIDDVIVQPLVVSKSVELHPVVVILAIVAGGSLGGILGMIVAVPLTSIIKVTVSILYWGFTKYYIFSPPPFAGDKTVAVLPLARGTPPPRRLSAGPPAEIDAAPRRKGKRRR